MRNRYPDLDRGENIEKVLGVENFENTKKFPSSEVFQYGVWKKDKICEKVVDFWLEIYFNAVGDLALRYLPYGGIYLCGGMTCSIKDYLVENKDSLMV